MTATTSIQHVLNGTIRRSAPAVAGVLAMVLPVMLPSAAMAQSRVADGTGPEPAEQRGANPAAAGAARDPGALDSIEARVDSIFAEWDRPDSPGCMLGVVRDGRFVYRRGYGSANLDYGIPLSDESVFYMASVSKQFVAASIALAAEHGHLSIDDRVRRWIPDLPDYGRPLTIRHLIHHTSGIRDYLGLMGLAGMGYDEGYSDAEIVDLITRQRELNFAPGDEYVYSNSGYFLLAEIVERATGQSLREYAAANIFEPLGMESTHFHDRPRHVLPNRVFSYHPDEDAPEGVRIGYLLNFDKVGSGGLYSSVADLIRWDRAFYDSPLRGGQSLIERLHTRGVLNDGDTLDYAFGLSIGEYRGLRTVGHGGSMMGFRTAILRFPDQRFTVLCLCNIGDANAPALAERVAEIYLEDAFRQPLAFGGNEDTEGDGAEDDAEGAESGEGSPARAALRALAGEYHSPELGVSYALEYDDDGLVLRWPGGADRRLEASDTDTFRAGRWTIRLERNDAARVTGFRLATGRVRRLLFERR